MALADLAHEVVTPERFAQGMTFAEYLDFIATPENLAREAGWWRGPERVNWSARLREWHARLHLREAQAAAIRWLAAQPDVPGESPNADLVNAFLNEKDAHLPGGTTYQSVPVAAFFTRDFRYLWHYI